jgi:hypothetical protein
MANKESAKTKKKSAKMKDPRFTTSKEHRRRGPFALYERGKQEVMPNGLKKRRAIVCSYADIKFPIKFVAIEEEIGYGVKGLVYHPTPETAKFLRQEFGFH